MNAEGQQAGHLIRVERPGQALLCLRCTHLNGGILGAGALALQIAEERARRGQAPLDAARAEPPGVLRGREGADLAVAQSVPGCKLAPLAMIKERLKVLPVSGDRVVADPPFGAQMPEEPVDPLSRGSIHGRRLPACLQRVRANETRSEMRDRNSVLMPG